MWVISWIVIMRLKHCQRSGPSFSQDQPILGFYAVIVCEPEAQQHSEAPTSVRRACVCDVLESWARVFRPLIRSARKIFREIILGFSLRVHWLFLGNMRT